MSSYEHVPEKMRQSSSCSLSPLGLFRLLAARERATDCLNLGIDCIVISGVPVEPAKVAVDWEDVSETGKKRQTSRLPREQTLKRVEKWAPS